MGNHGESESQEHDGLLRWMYYAGLIAKVGVVALQMTGVRGGFITSYGADMAGPVWMYTALRRRVTVLRYLYRPLPSPVLTAVFVFLVGTVWELCQTVDLGAVIRQITRGRFDPYDIVAYAASLIACVIVDVYSRQRS
ncbi:MAG: hypothetical protein GF341_10760 [candidate division Zixibacteria bacterium]|nr:hypothetical protein [candidate division Zixibacteria bacterium]